MKKRGNPMMAAHTDVRISVADFGPIESGTVDLRPLTVFVGPSNTGKTYFAILIYALHRIMEGFPRLPWLPSSRHYHYWERAGESARAGTDVRTDELKSVLDKLDTVGRPFRFSELSKSMRDIAHSALGDSGLLRESIETEIKRCFDIESVHDLVRLSELSPKTASGMEVSLAVGEENRDLWSFEMRISEAGVNIDGHIEDMILLPEGWSPSDFAFTRLFNGFRRRIKEIPGTDSPRIRWYLFEEFVEELLELLSMAAVRTGREAGTHYLPAARSGIMQSHRVIASSLVARSTRAGLERFPELPTFSGVMADFIQRLILYKESQAGDKVVRKIADALESESLAGRIRTNRHLSAGYPEFVYRPHETRKDIRLTRASSMVSELAPVVLFLRGAIGRGDMLIIEEPEAHLHPAAQTQMAGTLARMVRAGLRVVVTTHSDWLLKEIGNLMREGELGDRTGETTTEDPLPTSLRPSDVGIWLFRKDWMSWGSMVEEIPFDRSEGVEPQDYEDVAEALYNRSAILQNRFEEAAASDNE